MTSEAEVSGPIPLVRPRVVVVDDSAPLRAAIAEALEEGGCDVVGRAMDGGMALRMVLELDPDVVTCDLEMPRMDGFTFIRVLMNKKAVPIIVVTSDARPEAALMALDLGARDFVVKPSTRPGALRGIGPTLVPKVRALAAERARRVTWADKVDVPPVGPRDLVVIGASTGGPSALRDMLGGLSHPQHAPILIAQHMPERFTAAFAERLRKTSGLDVQEAKDGEPVARGHVRIAPGGKNITVERGRAGLIVRVLGPLGSDAYVPSVDRLFTSAAGACPSGLLGIVLTGMGRDGAEGAIALRKAGAPLWAESRATAVIDGMPSAAARAHGAASRLALDELGALLLRAVMPPSGA